MKSKNDDLVKRATHAAIKILKLNRDRLIVELRFLNTALMQLSLKPQFGLEGVMSDGEKLVFDPVFIIEQYHETPAKIIRLYLHTVLHNIFFHSFNYSKVDSKLWDLSCDIAVENIVLELGISNASLNDDAVLSQFISTIRKDVKSLTADRIYHNFLVNPLAESDLNKYSRLFKRDLHNGWGESEELIITEEQWKKISERIKADIGTFSKDKNNSEALTENLTHVTKEKYDYAVMLRRFTMTAEDIMVNDDEFDYIYYTYGLTQYDNMPLIEPLEYKETEKIRDFAIVIDTSASCKGSIVRSFLKKTYSILSSEESFFKKMNVHIIQCDNAVTQDVKITSKEDFDYFMKNGKLSGFGGTDFRPAFRYIDEMIERKEFVNFKGLLYFTDGYGIYPEKSPEYDAMFIFLKDDDMAPELPWWGIRVVLTEDEIESNSDSDFTGY